MGTSSASAIIEVKKSSEAVAEEARRALETDGRAGRPQWEEAIGDMATALAHLLSDWEPDGWTGFAEQRALFELVSNAARTFGSAEAGFEWLNAPNRALGGATPSSLLATGPEGVKQAQSLLDRLADGTIS